jgi:hypothetical protein
MTLRPIGLDNQIGRDRGPVAAALAVASSAAGRTAAIDRNPVQRKSMMTNGRLLIARTCYPCVLAKVAPEPHPEKLGRLERIAASRDVDMHWWSDGGFLTLDDLEVDTDGAKDKSKKKEPEKAEAPHHDVTPSACARFRTLCKPEHRPP